MEGDIAYFVINNIYLNKQDFILSICQRNHTNLIAYIDLYNKINYMNKKNNKFWFIKHDYYYGFIEDNFYGLYDEDFSVENKDYIFIQLEEDEIVDELDKSMPVKQYSTDFIHSIMKPNCRKALDNINYIKENYKYYIQSLKDININS